MNLKKFTTSSKRLYDKSLAKVVSAAILVAFLNADPLVHNAIINLDMHVAIGMNSVLGHIPVFDRTIGWLSTRTGDVFMLGGIGLLFACHSFCGANLDEVIRRGAFWIWLGFLCTFTYCISSSLESLVKRDTPLLVLHQFQNLQTMYGITFRSCPTSSFPSGHAMASLFFAIMASWKYFRMSLVLWCLAIIVLSLRLILGLHWLSDIIFGSLSIVLFLVALIEDTPVKNTYKYSELTVSVAVRQLLTLYRRLRRFHQAESHMISNL